MTRCSRGPQGKGRQEANLRAAWPSGDGPERAFAEVGPRQAGPGPGFPGGGGPGDEV